MYQNAAILAAVVLVYSAIAGRVARSWLSGPILFVAAGLAVGPLGLNLLRLDITANDLRVLAEAALAMVLFTDAAHADLAVIRRALGLPERLLLIGLPLTIVLGFLPRWRYFRPWTCSRRRCSRRCWRRPMPRSARRSSPTRRSPRKRGRH